VSAIVQSRVDGQPSGGGIVAVATVCLTLRFGANIDLSG